MSGSVISILISFAPPTNSGRHEKLMSILQIKKLRIRKFKGFAQGNRDRKYEKCGDPGTSTVPDTQQGLKIFAELIHECWDKTPPFVKPVLECMFQVIWGIWDLPISLEVPGPFLLGVQAPFQNPGSFLMFSASVREKVQWWDRPWNLWR